jgi:hypothetical protein
VGALGVVGEVYVTVAGVPAPTALTSTTAKTYVLDEVRPLTVKVVAVEAILEPTSVGTKLPPTTYSYTL